jgi:hypothetical protein
VQSGPHLIYSCGTKLGHTFPQALLRHRHCIVQVRRSGLHAVFLIQNDFRWRADCGGVSVHRRKDKVVVDLWEVKVPTLTSQKKSNVRIASCFCDVRMGHPHPASDTWQLSQR